jgi:hypothetical protein
VHRQAGVARGAIAESGVQTILKPLWYAEQAASNVNGTLSRIKDSPTLNDVPKSTQKL